MLEVIDWGFNRWLQLIVSKWWFLDLLHLDRQMVISNTVSRLLVLAVAAAWLAASICNARDVALFNSYEERIVLAIDKADVYIVGYRTGDKACFFNDTNGPDTSSVFPGIERYQLPFNSSYSGMEEIAGSRKNISLRISELDSIKNLYKLDEASSLARCMLFTVQIVQMVAEAIRYGY
ncbi:hypothetical protein POM88_032854 [Heracleum sosnowskyi]|uniref:rRNA N-glycosylase n=1 Tax=Heracleum sosnowskyi TaxID=360622 RepID=A0AAD8I187_9APIA|nr:hypothetical protein POM88_032854 [Heracleum sosnowskyi]